MIPDFPAMEARKKWYRIFQCWGKEKKELSAQNSIPSENILQVSCRDEDILRSKEILLPEGLLVTVKMAKGSSSEK